MNSNLPKKANVVVIGGGIAGCSVAYHLAKKGMQDVLLLERKQLGSGTSYHAAGMIRDLLGSESNTWLSSYSNKLFSGLQAETGVDIHYRKVGSLFVTHNDERMKEFQTTFSIANSFDIEAYLLGQKEITDIWSLLNSSDLVGALYMPNDALVNPYLTTIALAEGAKKYGAGVFEETPVTGIEVKGNKAVGVQTKTGYIECNKIVICGGMWSKDFLKPIGVTVPLGACEHYYLITEEIEGVHLDLPAVRDYDARCYLRPAGGTYWHDKTKHLMCGFFEAIAKPWGTDGIPEDFAFGRLEEDWEHLEDVIGNVKHRVPTLKNAKIEMLFNGPESFTNDNTYLVGKAPQVDGIYLGTGLCSRGIQAAGGIGYLLSEMIEKGYHSIPLDITDIDPARSSNYTINKKYLSDRTTESLGLLFDYHYPYRQFESARSVKQTPFHYQLKALGANFGETAGWERANFYCAENDSLVNEYSFEEQKWHSIVEQEHHAVRNNIGVFDLTSFAKFLVQGKDAVSYLNQICGAQLDVAIGRIVYTQALNEQGGIEADWTITRMAENEFMVVSGVVSQNRDFYFLKNNISQNQAVTVTDITSAYAVLGIMGPNSRQLLEAFSADDFSNEAFPFYRSKIIDFGYARVRANRLSYVGELGWEIYIPTEFATGCLEQLLNYKDQFNFKMVGYYAMNALRLEKGYRHWGHDICSVDTPFEAGLSFAVNFKKDQFNGRFILWQQKEKGIRRSLAYFTIADKNAHPHHLEPIYRIEGNKKERVGRITSAQYCHTLQKTVCLGYIECKEDAVISDEYLSNGNYETEVMAKSYPMKLHLTPQYDPKSESMRV